MYQSGGTQGSCDRLVEQQDQRSVEKSFCQVKGKQQCRDHGLYGSSGNIHKGRGNQQICYHHTRGGHNNCTAKAQNCTGKLSSVFIDQRRRNRKRCTGDEVHDTSVISGITYGKHFQYCHDGRNNQSAERAEKHGASGGYGIFCIKGEKRHLDTEDKHTYVRECAEHRDGCESAQFFGSCVQCSIHNKKSFPKKSGKGKCGAVPVLEQNTLCNTHRGSITAAIFSHPDCNCRYRSHTCSACSNCTCSRTLLFASPPVRIFTIPQRLVSIQL